MRTFLVPLSMVATCSLALGQVYPFWPIGEATSGVQARDQGLADLIRAKGQFELDRAQAVAAMNAENQLQIDRRRDQFAAYDALRRQRLAETRERNIANRESRQERQLAMLPKPLSESDFDPQTGGIHWPSVLMQASFEPSRVKIEGLFQGWAKANQSGQPMDLGPLVQAIGELRDQLKKQITSLDTTTYLQGRRFLDSLEVSARGPARS